MKGVSIKQLDAIIILDEYGNRIAVKYYTNVLENKDDKNKNKNQCEHNFMNSNQLYSKEHMNNFYDESYNNLKTVDEQKQFEHDIVDKIKKTSSLLNEIEILVSNQYIILCLPINDIYIYVVGDETSNELVLYEVMKAIQDSLNNITNNNIGKKQLIDKLDSIYLLLDEIIDNGVIMETNPSIIVNRLYMNENDIQDLTSLNQAISSAKDNIIRSLLSGT
ncbi:coatomer subunit zeta, putative [Plasmodium berghei]|uniref:Coatomer subunit zeta n=2 Tax=Plasmodium berghei TaxID=5821 RepID=A0A509AHZ5_PLABA|nr:coatomer subunit zeta, putative [Plasmodium berghei ANKA]CXI26341.1 coatomer subunit zeta, putative [Plasmodium berghei]SCM20492.1 coatomer subunit zeta, putative [Plasmodium berghei]SCN24072.1 coatomer subunit zeta, putative [Plasmodium berghei]SCO59382.1 coatomer subunit zeta, putative [Plasmodium berghei]SCO60549.1 coatomer subunit zeta, putative [Plasmodium berghei]|eukprot:XP_034420919.1 coatomer subunit zeta, putative [Plasmodium berghei ANKA]